MLQVVNNKHQHLLMKATEKQLKIYKVKIIYSVYKKNSINYLDIQHRNETIQLELGTFHNLDPKFVTIFKS